MRSPVLPLALVAAMATLTSCGDDESCVLQYTCPDCQIDMCADEEHCHWFVNKDTGKRYNCTECGVDPSGMALGCDLAATQVQESCGADCSSGPCTGCTDERSP